MDNKFCDFLINIGLIDLKTSKNLKQINHDVINAKNEHNFSDCFFISLMHYFNNLTIDQKKYMCFNLPLRFLLNKEKEKRQKMSLIILKKQLKEKLLKIKYLFNWLRNNRNKKKKITKQASGGSLLNNRISFDEFINKNNKTNSKINYKDKKNLTSDTNNSKNKSYLKIKNNISFNKSKVNNYYNNKTIDIINSKDMLTTSDKLELLQLSECTFKPSINTTNNSFRNTNTTFEKLYQDSEKYRIKKNIKAMELEYIKTRDLTFKPNFCQTPKSLSNMKFETFEIRQKNFIKNKNFNTNKLKKNIEKYAERKCSFSPKINKIIDFTPSSFNNNDNKDKEKDKNKGKDKDKEKDKDKDKDKEDIKDKDFKDKSNEENKYINTNNNNCDSYYSISTIKTIPAHIRLYDDSKRRNSSYMQREIEYKNLISEMANRTSKKFSKVNYNKLNDLHENKGKRLIIEKTKRKVEEEEGITFKPDLNLNNKYTERIFSNFYDRNKNHKKNIVYENYEKFEVEEVKEKKYTEDEKKEIVKNIVQRLYNEPMTQNLLLPNKNECNKYIKSNNLVDASRTNIQKQNTEYSSQN